MVSAEPSKTGSLPVPSNKTRPFAVLVDSLAVDNVPPEMFEAFKPVRAVPIPEAIVPKAGVINVGDVDKTTFPEPVVDEDAEPKAAAIWFPEVALLAIEFTAVEDIVTSPVTVCGFWGENGLEPVK